MLELWQSHVESGDCNYNYPNSPDECFIGDNRSVCLRRTTDHPDDVCDHWSSLEALFLTETTAD